MIKKIGFIGLGHMGLPMAKNLVKAGHQVTGFDLQASAQQSLADAGGYPASSLQEVAQNQDAVFTMLQTGEQVQKVCLGEHALFSILPKNTLYLDCSTIDVPTAREIHQHAEKQQILMVDAPVSGGVAGAAAGTLTFMVGGTEPNYHEAAKLLTHLGKTIIHAGDAGSGQAAKLCNNMVLGISMIAISEAFTLAQHLGLSAEKLFEVMHNASGQCWALDRYIPVPGVLDNVPANHHYQPGFTVAMMLKDLYLSQASAESVDLKTPMGRRATELYQQFSDEGMSQLDFSAIIKLIQASS